MFFAVRDEIFLYLCGGICAPLEGADVAFSF